MIKNSVILVTGANRGIGKAYVEEFLKAGAKKIYVGVRNLETIKTLIKDNPGKLVPLELDVTNPEHIKNATDTARDINLLVSNAGVAYMGNLLDENDIINARTEMEVNYFGPLSLIHAFAPVIKKNGGGTIAVVSSIGGILLFPGAPTYCSSKTAVHFLIQAARMELASQNIHVLGIYPGPVDTDMAAGFDAQKASPQHIALETIKAIDEGREDLFPDPYAIEIYKSFCNSPKEAENNVRKMYDSMKDAA